VIVVVPTEEERSERHPRVAPLRASRSRIVVATQRAVQARSWLAIPNIGQIVEMVPFRMNHRPPGDDEPGRQHAPSLARRLAQLGNHAPHELLRQERPMRVPVSSSSG